MNLAADRKRELPMQVEELLSAIWTLTRQAKRDRDKSQSHYQQARNRVSYGHVFARAERFYKDSTAAKKRKERYYRLKGQALAHLLDEGVLKITGMHRFGDNFAEVVEGQGYRFHRPCPAPGNAEGIDDLGEAIEAKPKKKKELGIRAAVATVEAYLCDKPVMEVYQWAPRPRREIYCWNCGEPGHVASECCDDSDGDCGDEAEQL